MKIHGSTNVRINNIQCGYDGSFGNFVIDKGMYVYQLLSFCDKKA
jgi:hypothetical protein